MNIFSGIDIDIESKSNIADTPIIPLNRQPRWKLTLARIFGKKIGYYNGYPFIWWRGKLYWFDKVWE